MLNYAYVVAGESLCVLGDERKSLHSPSGAVTPLGRYAILLHAHYNILFLKSANFLFTIFFIPKESNYHNIAGALSWTH